MSVTVSDKHSITLRYGINNGRKCSISRAPSGVTSLIVIFLVKQNTLAYLRLATVDTTHIDCSHSLYLWSEQT